MSKNKVVTLAALLGAITMNVGIGTATLFSVSLAPPFLLLSVTVTNAAWALMFFYVVKKDIELDFVGGILVGASITLLSLLAYFSILESAAIAQPANIASGSTAVESYELE